MIIVAVIVGTLTALWHLKDAYDTYCIFIFDWIFSFNPISVLEEQSQLLIHGAYYQYLNTSYQGFLCSYYVF